MPISSDEWIWWVFSVFVVGIAINLISYYFQPIFAMSIFRSTGWLKSRSASYRLRVEESAREAAGNSFREGWLLHAPAKWERRANFACLFMGVTVVILLEVTHIGAGFPEHAGRLRYLTLGILGLLALCTSFAIVSLNEMRFWVDVQTRVAENHNGINPAPPASTDSA
jgi:hypothetical protein